MHSLEEDLELRVDEIDVLAAKDLGDELAAGLEDAAGYAQGGEEQLRLDVDVEVVQAGDVGGAVADDEVDGVRGVGGCGGRGGGGGWGGGVGFRVEGLEDARDRGRVRDVAFQHRDAVEGRHGL